MEQHQQNEKSLWEAVLAVQKKVSILAKDSENPFYKSQYLSLPELIRNLQPVLIDNGLVVSQHPKKPGEVETAVVHAKTGESFSSTIELPIKDQTPQGAGSAISYARRYALMAIFNIAAEDDDAEKSAKRKAALASNAATVPAKSDFTKTARMIGAQSDPKMLKDWAKRIESSDKFTKEEKEQLINRINAKLPAKTK